MKRDHLSNKGIGRGKSLWIELNAIGQVLNCGKQSSDSDDGLKTLLSFQLE